MCHPGLATGAASRRHLATVLLWCAQGFWQCSPGCRVPLLRATALLPVYFPAVRLLLLYVQVLLWLAEVGEWSAAPHRDSWGVTRGDSCLLPQCLHVIAFLGEVYDVRARFALAFAAAGRASCALGSRVKRFVSWSLLSGASLPSCWAASPLPVVLGGQQLQNLLSNKILALRCAGICSCLVRSWPLIVLLWLQHVFVAVLGAVVFPR